MANGMALTAQHIALFVSTELTSELDKRNVRRSSLAITDGIPFCLDYEFPPFGMDFGLGVHAGGVLSEGTCAIADVIGRRADGAEITFQRLDPTSVGMECCQYTDTRTGISILVAVATDASIREKKVLVRAAYRVRTTVRGATDPDWSPFGKPDPFVSRSTRFDVLWGHGIIR